MTDKSARTERGLTVQSFCFWMRQSDRQFHSTRRAFSLLRLYIQLASQFHQHSFAQIQSNSYPCLVIVCLLFYKSEHREYIRQCCRIDSYSCISYLNEKHRSATHADGDRDLACKSVLYRIVGQVEQHLHDPSLIGTYFLRQSSIKPHLQRNSSDLRLQGCELLESSKETPDIYFFLLHDKLAFDHLLYVLSHFVLRAFLH